MAEPLVVLVAARDEEARIASTVAALRAAFPESEVVVADDGSRDGTAAEALRAGARVVRLPRLGKGQALTLAEREAPPGALLLADADLEGDLGPLFESLRGGAADLVVAAFAERQGGGFGIAKRAAGALVRVLGGVDVREPLSGQRALSPAARAACFPLAPGFGCEVRMTIDAARAGLQVEERELDLGHRATGRDPRGFLHRGRQLLDAMLACGPTATNYRGLRLPLVGAVVALVPGRLCPAVAATAALGLADDFWSGPERGFRAHLGRGSTTGVAKAVGIPLVALATTRSVRKAMLVALAANALNQLDTRPGRALKAFLAGAALVRGDAARYVPPAVLLAPYDLREMTMLGDAGANALGAVLGFGSVGKLTDRGQILSIVALATLTAVGETRSLGELIERTPGLRRLDALGRA